MKNKNELRRMGQDLPVTFTKKSALLFVGIVLLGSLLSLFDSPMLIGLRIPIILIYLLILPGFVILLHEDRTFSIERWLLVITFSLAFWTVIGYIMIQGQIPLTLGLIMGINDGFGLIMIGLFIIRNKNSPEIEEKMGEEAKKDSLAALRKFVKSELFLLIIFLILLGIYASIRIPYVPTEDVWFHMYITEDYLDDGILVDYTLYRGNTTYHILGAAFCRLTGLDVMNLAKFAGVFQLPFGCLVFYYFLREVLRNEEIALLVTFAFSLTSMGTILNFTQYWPTAFIIVYGFQLNRLFFHRINAFQEEGHNDFSNNLSYYLIQSFLGACIILSHVTSAIVYFVPLIFILFMLTLRCVAFFKELLFYSALFAINIIVNPFGVEVILRLDFAMFAGYEWLVLIAIPIGVLAFVYIERFFNKYSYSTQNPKPGFFDPENVTFLIDDKMYRKIIVPSLIIIGPLLYYLMNIQTKNYYPANIYAIAIDIAIVSILISAGIMGISFYKDYSLTGKINFLYLIYIAALLGALTVLSVVYTYFIRMVNLYVPFLFIGFGFYLLYNLKHIFKSKRNLRILKVLFVMNIITSFVYQATFHEHVTVSKNRFVERSSFYMAGEMTGDPDEESSLRIIGNFYYNYPYIYHSHGYPIDYNQYASRYIHIENHTTVCEDGTEINNLQRQYPQQKVDNVFVLIEEDYETRGIVVLDGVHHGELTEEEVDQYNNIDYLNRVAVGNHEKTLFWVHPPAPGQITIFNC